MCASLSGGELEFQTRFFSPANFFVLGGVGQPWATRGGMGARAPQLPRGDLCARDRRGASPRCAGAARGHHPSGCWFVGKGVRDFENASSRNPFRARRFSIPRISLNLGSGRRWWHPVIHQRCACLRLPCRAFSVHVFENEPRESLGILSDKNFRRNIPKLWC